jgi:hypothetical protein
MWLFSTGVIMPLQTHPSRLAETERCEKSQEKNTQMLQPGDEVQAKRASM